MFDVSQVPGDGGVVLPGSAIDGPGEQIVRAGAELHPRVAVDDVVVAQVGEPGSLRAADDVLGACPLTLAELGRSGVLAPSRQCRQIGGPGEPRHPARETSPSPSPVTVRVESACYRDPWNASPTLRLIVCVVITIIAGRTVFRAIVRPRHEGSGPASRHECEEACQRSRPDGGTALSRNSPRTRS